ncbi:MAG: hypothetical protein IJ132_01705 [Firmicutes bacterium]|nr:hypothetical protein [Bacillota bacterium]
MSREKKRYDLRSLKLATIAFAILALANFAVQIIRIIEKSNVVEFAYLAVLFIAWTMMFIAARTLSEYGPDFKAAGVVSVPGMAAVVICALLLVSAISSGVGKNAHLSMGVQFSLYISFLMMVMAYWYVLRGAGKLCEGFNRTKLEKSCKSIRIPAIIILILALIAVQGAPVFSELNKYIVTGIAAALALIVQMVMISKLLSVYDAVDGKLQPGRLGDVLKDSNVTGKPKAVEKKAAAKKKEKKNTTENNKTEENKAATNTTEKGTSATSAPEINTSETKTDETKTSETNESEKNAESDKPETAKADTEKSDIDKSDTEETETKNDSDSDIDNNNDNDKEEPSSDTQSDKSDEPDESTDIIEEDWLREELEENQKSELETAFFPEPEIKVHTETK